MKTFMTFIQKELYHIFRDVRTMMILLVMPIIQIILFGFAISTEVKNARMAVVDPCKDAVTREVIERLNASEYFTLVAYYDTPEELERDFRQNKISFGVVFSDRFGENLERTGKADLQFITDATDPNTATVLSNYATAIVSSFNQMRLPINNQIKLLYNPSMQSAYNFVPGVMGMILMLICAMMTSISIVREKERGTMEVLLVSPIRPIFIILAKAVPYMILSIVNLCTILLLSFFVLNVPIAGSMFWLIFVSVLFIFVALALGLLISSIVETQVAAMLASGMVLMMPTVLLSGMMFPIENMPIPLQVLSSALPARWYIEAIRKLMIQGVEVQYVLKEIAVLSVMAVALITLSLKKFKVRL